MCDDKFYYGIREPEPKLCECCNVNVATEYDLNIIRWCNECAVNDAETNYKKNGKNTA